MRLQPLIGDAAFEVAQDLPLPRPEPRPVRVEVERVRVQMRLHVARQTRVGVDPPGTADPVFAVEDGEVVKTCPAQQDPESDTTGPGADDADPHWILRHCPPSMTSSEPVMNDA